EADVGTPTCLPAINRLKFSFSFMGRPQRTEVVIKVRKRRKLLPQLARPHVPVVIDPRRCLTSSTGKWPFAHLLKVCVLRTVMSGNRSNVGNVLHEALAGVVVGKYPIAVTFRQARPVRVHLGKNL